MIRDDVSMSGSSERSPLLASSGSRLSEGKHEETDAGNKVKMTRHITLPYAVAIIVGNVIGSGIFLSPKGVTQNIGSVGGSLLIWGLTGIYNLAQALCYAELGALIPRSGGDYAYLYYTLGPLAAFLCAWLHVVVIASSSCAVIARTAALYLLESFDLQCHLSTITLVAVAIIVSLAFINCLSAKWGTRVHAIFSVAKSIALLIIIGVGIYSLAAGNTENFTNAFEGTTNDPGGVALAVLDGYFAYKGWELINALPEEMVNPQRDLPLAVWIGMTLVTVIYVLTNVAYFAVLSPAELLQSDAVALTFAQRAMGGAAWLVPLFVFFSCSGTVNGDFLSNSRYLFAGGRFKQVPQMFSMIQINLLTPIPAIVALCVFALMYTVITDLQKMQEYASLSVQVKMLLTLTALFYLRWKHPHIHRPMKVNTVVAVVTFLIMIALVVLSFYKAPLQASVGVAVYLAGVPLYYLGRLCQRSDAIGNAMDYMTSALQRLIVMVPDSSEVDDQQDFTKTL